MVTIFNMVSLSCSRKSGFVSINKSFKGRFVETLDYCFPSQSVEETPFRKRLNHIGDLFDLKISDLKHECLMYKNQAAKTFALEFHYFGCGLK